MKKITAIVTAITVIWTGVVPAAYAYEMPDLSGYFQHSGTGQGSGTGGFSAPSSWSERASELVSEIREQAADGPAVSLSGYESRAEAIREAAADSIGATTTFPQIDSSFTYSSIIADLPDISSFKDSSVSQIVQQNREEFQQRIATMQQSFQETIASFRTEPSFVRPPITPSPITPSPVIPGNTIDTAAMLTQVFGPQASNFTPEQVQVLSQAIIDVGGTQHAQEIVVELRDIFGTEHIDSLVTNFTDQIPGMLTAVDALGDQGLTGFVQEIADALGMSFKDTTSGLREDLPDHYVFYFLDSAVAAGSAGVTQGIRDLNSYFSQERVRQTFSCDPCSVISAAGEINTLGIDTFTSHMQELARTLSLSEAEMKENITNLFLSDTTSFWVFVSNLDEDITPVTEGLKTMISVFGQEAMTAAFAVSPGNVINTMSSIDWYCPGGIAGLPAAFTALAQAFGVSEETMTQAFASPNVFLNNTLSQVMMLLYDTSGVFLQPGEGRALQYMAEMTTIYGSDAAFRFLSQQFPTFMQAIDKIDEMGGLQNLVDGLSASYPRSEVIYTLQDMGLAAMARFYPEDLTELVGNRLTNADDGRPLAVIVGPEDDWSGVFAFEAGTYHRLIEAGFRVVYYEAGTDSDLPVVLGNATQQGADPARLIIICGHGTQTSIAVGTAYDETAAIDTGDYNQFIGINAFLETGGTVILNSCSNGQGMAQEANMANMFAQLFPGAAHVFSVIEPSALSSITISPGNYVTDAVYAGPMYDAALYDTNFTFNGMDAEVLEAKIDATYQEIK